MANTPSNLMSNIFAGTKNATPVWGARARVIGPSVITSVVGDAANHLYPVFRVSCQWRLRSIKAQIVADAGWTDCDFNLYAGNAAGTLDAGDWTLADQIAIPSSRLSDANDFSSATAGADEILGFGASAYAEQHEGKRLWELVGLSADPGNIMWDIVMQSIGNPAGGGTGVFTLTYTAGD